MQGDERNRLLEEAMCMEPSQKVMELVEEASELLGGIPAVNMYLRLTPEKQRALLRTVSEMSDELLLLPGHKKLTAEQALAKNIMYVMSEENNDWNKKIEMLKLGLKMGLFSKMPEMEIALKMTIADVEKNVEKQIKERHAKSRSSKE